VYQELFVATWGGWDEARHERHFADCISRGHISIIEMDGMRVGMIQLFDEPCAVDVGEIQIEPRHQNRGVGAVVLKSVIAHAHGQGKAVRLSTGLKNLGALRLYQRLGFLVVARTETHYHLVFQPEANVSEDTWREQIQGSTEFLNVDLDLFADFDLKQLVEALEPLVCLHVAEGPPYEAHLEGSCSVPSASVAIEAILEAIDALSPANLDRFKRCTGRRLDIGSQSGLEPRSWHSSIPPSLLRRIGELDIELAFTIYGTRTRYRSSNAAKP
jgi:GNAT superfamily N-acetyltransferase